MNSLNKEYTDLIDSLKSYLEEIRAEVDGKENRGESGEGIIKEYQPIFFPQLDEHIKILEIIASDFGREDHKIHKQYLQKALHPIALKAPFNKRCFEKPLGYPGDYIMMEMIYSDPYQGESIFTRLLNAHSLSAPITNDVRNRNRYIEGVINKTVQDIPNASILSVGAGPGREIREFLNDRNECNAQFYLLDQEKKALNYIKSRLNGNADSVYFINEGVKSLIRKDFHIQFDLIYSMGLFDYLPDKFAKRVLQCLYKSLKKGGKLIIGNAKSNPCKIWMEHGTKWYLIYRNTDDLLNLAEELCPAPQRLYVDGNNKEQLFIFLVIEK